MTTPISVRLERARELRAAAVLREAGYPTQALGRLDYTCFHAAHAALLHLGHTPKTHSGVLSTFAKFVVREGGFDPAVARTLRTLLERRTRVDYVVDDAEVGDLEPLQDGARRFVAAVEMWLER